MNDKTVLPNGVKIITKKMPHVRSVSMGVWVNVGARDETDAQSGLCHFIEHMIFKGTARRSAFQIAKEFDAIGGHTNAFTSMEHTCYHAKVLDTHLETMADILLDIFLNSTFDQLEVERERPVIFQEIGMVEDNPEEYLHQLAGKNFWGDHPLGRSILGTRENLSTFRDSTIKNFFHRFYHPERIVIAVAGNVDHEHIISLIGPAVEAIHNGQKLPQRLSPQTCAGIDVHPRTIEQAHISLATQGISATDPRRFAFSLLNTLFGGNMSSRLFQTIREKHGLAYSVYSYISSHEDSGMFGIYAGVTKANVARTIELVTKEMQALAQSPVLDDELQDAIEYTKGNLYMAAESVDNQMVRLAQNEIHYHDYIPLNTVIKKVEAVGVDEIQALAKTLFQPETLSLTLLGPVKDNIDLAKLIAL